MILFFEKAYLSNTFINLLLLSFICVNSELNLASMKPAWRQPKSLEGAGANVALQMNMKWSVFL